MKKIKKISHQFIRSTFALSLISASILSPAQAEITVEPIHYDTVIAANGQFMDVDTDEFLLHQQEWYTIQAYVQEALRLPITQSAMVSAFAIPSSVAFSNFQALLNEYKLIHATANDWNSSIYPSVVNLALKLGNYADIHRLIIAPLIDSLMAMKEAAQANDPIAGEAQRNTAVALLTMLQAEAQTRQAETAKAESDLLGFAADIARQSGQLDQLRTTHSEYLQDDGSALKSQIATLNARVRQLNADYDHYVTVAATTASYAWIPFFGLIAAGSVAGVYGDKAEKARKERNQVLADISVLQQQLTYKENIYASYQKSHQSVIDLENKIRTAVLHINKLKGHWQGINSDFDTILESITATQGVNGLDNAIALVGSITAQASVGQIQTQWQQISVKASKFVENAYIAVSD
ncbi:alpha-xenorhabdolysin family binary toxin subunit A [Thalassomonas actiniarum]|uniref:Alpha-xenorhabdolysin family binary toxin subunit A n=1 Tax=Thalassomonas actiniarum TaxID=485447 RepID=A0AAE9YQQ9_9GAMM|nr:alpha-xenorhabdolysin family binary toxin subunit A [Thalassomonas actiniarum]WDD98538.1 alpha-xenorhabdolysin family binary toxin subunit A [Thalassomonas actiniarum]